MKYRPLLRSLGAIFSVAIVVCSACKKINDSTELGGGLIPPIDNVTTFDTIINVEAYNDTFSVITDSVYTSAGSEHFLGLINNDPFFGKTDARLFLELKPGGFGTYPFPRKDSIKIDSVVLVLDYLDNYGDSSVAQTVNVYELDPTVDFRADSLYLVTQNNFIYPPVSSPFPLGSRTFVPAILKDSIKAFRDTTAYQLRIDLDTSFGRRLFNYDTLNAYKNDSIFKSRFSGFALQSVAGGNAVMGFSLIGPNTKLAIYYKQPRKVGGDIDSSNVSYFLFTGASASANYVKRDYSGTPLQTELGGSLPDPFVYLQNAPGTFARIKIPGLNAITNRVVHRAELIAEEVFDPSDTVFKAPDYLYLDAFDTTIHAYRTIPYDLGLDGSGLINYSSFGAAPVISMDGSGNFIRTWHINISRYIQHVLTKTVPAYEFRLSAPYSVFEKYGTPPAASDLVRSVFVNQAIVRGRVRLAGNTGAGDTNPQRMRLRIIYSKL